MVGGSTQGLLALLPVVLAATGAVLAVALLFAGRGVRTRARWVVGFGVITLLAPVGPWVVQALDHDLGANGDVRLLTWNMQDNPDAVPDLARLLRTYQPDLVMLQQTPRAAVAADASIKAAYPYQVLTEGQGAPFSVAVLSRYPLEGVETFGRDVAVWPARRVVVAEAALPRGVATVVAAHLKWPLPDQEREYGAARDAQVRDLAELLADRTARTPRLLAAGDLNLTAREAAYDRLLDHTRLRDAVPSPRWGVAGTWRPVQAAVPPVLGLDHVLHTACLRPVEQQVDWRVGSSDHAPVLVAFVDGCADRAAPPATRAR
jgi:endonuclease/exonuclease/phosphatase (EEP) superfamily protein YafD